MKKSTIQRKSPKKSNSKSKFPYPIANWKNEKKYPNSKSTPSSQWSWEFLRRNPEYQKDWVLWGKILGDKNWKTACRNRNFKDSLIKKGKIDCLKYLANKYGLAHFMYDPKTPSPLLSFMRYFQKMPRYIREKIGPEIMPHEVLMVNYHFDLSRPLEPQLKSARDWLKIEKKAFGLKESKSNFKLFPRYLRILDGVAAGVEDKIIAEKLFPNIKNEYPEHQRNQTYSDSLKAALKKRDHEFIIFPPNPSKKKNSPSTPKK